MCDAIAWNYEKPYRVNRGIAAQITKICNKLPDQTLDPGFSRDSSSTEAIVDEPMDLENISGRWQTTAIKSLLGSLKPSQKP